MSYKPQHPTVWAEIPVTDLEASVAYYNAVHDFEITIDTTGPNPMAMLPYAGDGQSVAGHLYRGKPPARGTGPTIHIAVPGTAEEAAERAKAAGGEVVMGPIPIPMGRFIYTLDPDGNSIGLFEAS